MYGIQWLFPAPMMKITKLRMLSYVDRQEVLGEF